MNAYDQWIARYIARTPVLLGKCKLACEEMLATFPELKLIAGHVEDPIWGRRGHYWLMSPEGQIVDPTVLQFPAPKALLYELWKPGDTVCIGKCLQCGEEIWRPCQSLKKGPERYAQFCDEKCRKDFARNLHGTFDSNVFT